MISHRNVIANTLQTTTYDTISRKKNGVVTQVALGVLPLSHIFGLVNVAHVSMYRGDELIILPRFNLGEFLKAVETFKIEQLSIVPPILVQMMSRPEECRKYNLDSVRLVFTGAAPLGSETMARVQKMFPKWNLGQGYGRYLSNCPTWQQSKEDTTAS
jgi:acyl-CoA synthetase (AMP-forming)/AMP-acid ligase II